MQSIRQLKAIPDDELLRRLASLLEGSRHTEADLVAHIGEVDARRLYAREAALSMFVYCLERLHLSEAEAYLRIAAARASREHPMILEMLGDGRLHLTGVALLAPRPDVQPSIRRLPAGRRVPSAPSTARVELRGGNPPVEATCVGSDRLPADRELRPEQVDSEGLNGLFAGRLDTAQ